MNVNSLFRRPIAGLADVEVARAMASASFAGSRIMSGGALTPANVTFVEVGPILAAVVVRPRASGVFVFRGGCTVTAAGADAQLSLAPVFYEAVAGQNITVTGGAVVNGINVETGSGGGQPVVVGNISTGELMGGGSVQVPANALRQYIMLSGMFTGIKGQDSAIAVLGGSTSGVAYSSISLFFNITELP